MQPRGATINEGRVFLSNVSVVVRVHHLHNSNRRAGHFTPSLASQRHHVRRTPWCSSRTEPLIQEQVQAQCWPRCIDGRTSEAHLPTPSAGMCRESCSGESEIRGLRLAAPATKCASIAAQTSGTLHLFWCGRGRFGLETRERLTIEASHVTCNIVPQGFKNHHPRCIHAETLFINAAQAD